MTEIAPVEGGVVDIPTFFTPNAFELARQEASGITYDGVALVGLSKLMEPLESLPPLDDWLLVYRVGASGFRQQNDTAYERADPTARYVPAHMLSIPPHLTNSETVHKAAIANIAANEGRQVIEVWSPDFKPPLVRALAESVLIPPPEAHRMLASPVAWPGS